MKQLYSTNSDFKTYVDINDFDDDVKFGLKFKEFLQKEGYSYCVNMFNHYTIYKEANDGKEDS